MWFYGGRFSRYFSALILQYAVGGLLVFCCLFLVSDFLGQSGRFNQVATEWVIRYYLYALPEMIYMMLPIAFVLGVVFAIGTIQKNGELVALLSLGVSLRQIAGIVAGWGLLVGAGMMEMTRSLLPELSLKKNFTYYHHIRGNPGLYSIDKTSQLWYKYQDQFFYLRALDPHNSKGEGFRFYLVDPEQWVLKQYMEAESVEVQGHQWLLKRGRETLLNDEKHFPLVAGFESKKISMPEDLQVLSQMSRPSDILNLIDLKRFIEKQKEAGLDTLRFEVDYHRKFAFSLSGLVLGLLALGLVVRKGRHAGVMAQVGWVLGLVLVYWVLFSLSLNLGYYGKMPPWFAAFAANMLGTLLALWLLQRQRA
jgi:lipopolysaccharide export system permease protein